MTAAGKTGFIAALFGPRTIVAKTVIGSGSHVWDAIFHCGNKLSCAAEIFAYDIERRDPSVGMKWKCECGKYRALTRGQIISMQDDIKADAEGEP